MCFSTCSISVSPISKNWFYPISIANCSYFALSGICKPCCGVAGEVYLVALDSCKTIICAVNFYPIKYISLFCVLCAFLIYNILDSFSCFFYILQLLHYREDDCTHLLLIYMFKSLSASVSPSLENFIVFKSSFDFQVFDTFTKI